MLITHLSDRAIVSLFTFIHRSFSTGMMTAPTPHQLAKMNSRTATQVAAPILACTLLLAPCVVDASALTVVNTLRTRECSSPTSGKLKSDRGLDAVANQVMQGYGIEDALKRANFRAVRTATIRIRGDVSDASLKVMLSKSHCRTLADSRFTAVGFKQELNAIAIVLAAPFAPPAVAEANQIARQVLQLVNEARSNSRRCGAKRFGAVPPIELDGKLSKAAMTHAKDMAARGYISHEGSDQSEPADRVARTGYAWKAVGENVAAGQYTAKEVVDGWLASPGHCSNIMDADYTQMGVAYVSNPKQEIGIYWAQVFGRPR